MVEFDKKYNIALISGTDANAHNTYWNSRICDIVGEDRSHALLDFIMKENLFVENGGDTPTFDNGRWTNSIDLTITKMSFQDAWLNRSSFLRLSRLTPALIALRNF